MRKNGYKKKGGHLQEKLHVLITVTDDENRARIRMQYALDEINKLLLPPQGSLGKNGRQGAPDEIKKKQLMELAIINGTYRQEFEQ